MVRHVELCGQTLKPLYAMLHITEKVEDREEKTNVACYIAGNRQHAKNVGHISEP